MAAIFSITDGPPGGRERIAWWRASKRERGAKIAAMLHYKRHSYLDRLNIDKMLIRRSYDTYSRYECNNWHISFQVMEDAGVFRPRKIASATVISSTAFVCPVLATAGRWR